MRLRPSRGPVTRLSRKVLLGLGLAAAALVGGVLVFALQPQRPKAAGELYNTDSHARPEGLAALPRDYAALPKTVPPLGPPLPGDLGRPILKAGAPAPGVGSGPAAAESPRQQRAREAREAARTSRLFASTDAAGSASLPPPEGPAASGPSAPPAAAEPPPDHKLAFLNGAVDHRTESAERLGAPSSPYVVQAGAVIAAALLTGLQSDLPGQVAAQVTEDVYDSPTGRILLIPQGARLLGQYDAQVGFGQRRVLLVWTRLLLPNGRSLVLDRQPATDPQGFAGLADRVDNHWGLLFKSALLSTLLSVGSEAGTSNSENNLAQAIRQGASQGVSQTGEQVVGRSLGVAPTLTVRPGFPVRVLVARDLVLEPFAP
jgi:type IV secretion system protein VirB10